jgi:hypothetical protein
MDSPIDPINKSTEYVGVPNVDPWHESEKHKKKRFAKMLEDQSEDKKGKQEEQDEIVISDKISSQTTETHNETASQDGTADTQDAALPKRKPEHIDLKG